MFPVINTIKSDSKKGRKKKTGEEGREVLRVFYYKKLGMSRKKIRKEYSIFLFQ